MYSITIWQLKLEAYRTGKDKSCKILYCFQMNYIQNVIAADTVQMCTRGSHSYYHRAGGLDWLKIKLLSHSDKELSATCSVHLFSRFTKELFFLWPGNSYNPHTSPLAVMPWLLHTPYQLTEAYHSAKCHTCINTEARNNRSLKRHSISVAIN